jgi:periplasmic protein TonB
MFDQLIESTSIKKKSKRWMYFTSTAAIWMMVFATTIVAGIFAFDARLSDQFREITRLTPPLPVAKREIPATIENKVRPDRREAFVSAEKAPTIIPMPAARPPDISVVSGTGTPGGPGTGPGNPFGSDDGIPDGVLPGTLSVAKTSDPPPPPTPEVKKPDPPPAQKLLIRSHILQGSAIRRVEPPYPRIAREAGVRGTVVVEVTINMDGNVISARALSGHALLKEVSAAAARGWKWRPTMLNNLPVKVVGTITFNFVM